MHKLILLTSGLYGVDQLVAVGIPAARFTKKAAGAFKNGVGYDDIPVLFDLLAITQMVAGRSKELDRELRDLKPGELTELKARVAAGADIPVEDPIVDLILDGIELADRTYAFAVYGIRLFAEFQEYAKRLAPAEAA